MDEKIMTTAEHAEDAQLPRRYEVHTCGDMPTGNQPVPPNVARTAAQKSPARWAYERLALYVQAFEGQLDGAHEVAIGMTGGDAGVLRIEGMGYFDPDIVTFYGRDPSGARTQMIQHVSQLNVILRALPKTPEAAEPTRIGFRLAREIDADGPPG